MPSALRSIENEEQTYIDVFLEREARVRAEGGEDRAFGATFWNILVFERLRGGEGVVLVEAAQILETENKLFEARRDSQLALVNREHPTKQKKTPLACVKKIT